MTADRPTEYLVGLVRELCKLPRETEWAEFKENDAEPEAIGEYLSALANSAALAGKAFAYQVWGVRDGDHRVVGTKFSPGAAKVGNEELENWLLRSLAPKIHFRFFEVMVDGLPLVLLEIERAFRQPVQFKGQEFIRVGTYKKRLKDFPEKERALWRLFDTAPFESGIASERQADESVLKLLDYPAYFDLLQRPLPENRSGIMAALEDDKLISTCSAGGWDKVVFQTELYQLPAPLPEATDDHTRVVLFAHRPLSRMDKADRVRAVYMHACLRYVNREHMTNTSVRERFGIEARNSAAASRLIREAVEVGAVVPYDPEAAPKLMRYLPAWAAPRRGDKTT